MDVSGALRHGEHIGFSGSTYPASRENRLEPLSMFRSGAQQLFAINVFKVRKWSCCLISEQARCRGPTNNIGRRRQHSRRVLHPRVINLRGAIGTRPMATRSESNLIITESTTAPFRVPQGQVAPASSTR